MKKEKKDYKKELTLVAILLVVVLAVAYSKKQETVVEPTDEGVEIEEVVVSDEFVPTDTRVSVVEMEIVDAEYAEFEHLAFLLPEEWSISEMRDAETAVISVPDENYEVYLTMNVSDSGDIGMLGDPILEVESGARVYQPGCGGPFACYYLGLADNTEMYYIVFNLESSETAPENLDGVWTPSTEVTRDDLLNFVGTVLTKTL